MKYIVYGVNKVITGDEIAQAVLEYAAALAENGTTDIVDVPTADDYGQAAVASLLLGTAGQVMVEVAPDDALEPEDDALVAELKRRTELVGGARFGEPASGAAGDVPD